MTRSKHFLSVFALASVLAACGSSDEPPPNPVKEEGPLEIEGTWSSNFGGTEIIGADAWVSEYEDLEGNTVAIEQRIEAYSNSENEIVTQNPDDAGYEPSKFNRIIWTEMEGDSFYFCTTDHGLESAADAIARNTAADTSNKDESGCGADDFPWTKATRE